MRLYRIQEETRRRALAIERAHEGWPCRKGCADCCRQLAEPPRVTGAEWELLAAAIDRLPAEVRERIREGTGRVCPLLDQEAGACLVYEARPVACRAYGFYAERGKVLGCERIEALAEAEPDVVWGNHTALEEDVRLLGEAAPLAEWLARERK